MIQINWNDPFYGLMLGLGMLLLFGAYLAIFGEVVEDNDKKHKKARSS